MPVASKLAKDAASVQTGRDIDVVKQRTIVSIPGRKGRASGQKQIFANSNPTVPGSSSIGCRERVTLIQRFFFGFLAMHSRWCLVLGLIAGATAPALASALVPLIPVFVGLLLMLTAFRTGLGAAIGGISEGGRAFRQVLMLQAALPLTVCIGVLVLGQGVPSLVLAVILMLSAPSVTGAPNFAIMNGADPAPAMRMLVIGTALFPVLVLPVFWMLPQLGGIDGVIASVRLACVIVLSTGVGFALRWLFEERLDDASIRAVDGANAALLGVIVIGLMSAIGPMLWNDPVRLAGWIAVVFALNFGLQLSVFFLYRGTDRAAVSMIAGNRNVALFLVALPETVIEPLLIFVGCYQIPMYLTPILLKRLHAHA